MNVETLEKTVEQHSDVVCCIYTPVQHSNYVYMLNASLTWLSQQHGASNTVTARLLLCCSHTLHCNLYYLVQLGHLWTVAPTSPA